MSTAVTLNVRGVFWYVFARKSIAAISERKGIYSLYEKRRCYANMILRECLPDKCHVCPFVIAT